MDEFRQLSIWNTVVSSWSFEGDRPLLSAGLLFSYQSYQTYDGSLIGTLLCGCLLADPTSLSIKTKKMKKIMRSKWSLIRPNCVRKHFWSDPSAIEEVMIRPNCGQSRLWSDMSALEEVMIRPKCARSRLWSDPSALESAYDQTFQNKSTSDKTISRPSSRQTVVRSNFPPDPVISVWEHTGVRSTGSDHKPIWVWTSTWVFGSQTPRQVLKVVSASGKTNLCILTE